MTVNLICFEEGSVSLFGNFCSGCTYTLYIKMSSTNGFVPNFQSQLRYITQWFHEWSEMQRNDFLPILTEKFGGKGYVNGLLPGIDSISSFEDRPPSLFQCRIKLFKEWTDNWAQVEKDQLITYIKSADPDFLKRYEEEIASTNNVKASTECESNENTVESLENDDNTV